jgi:hypothetical protein
MAHVDETLNSFSDYYSLDWYEEFSEAEVNVVEFIFTELCEAR